MSTSSMMHHGRLYFDYNRPRAMNHWTVHMKVTIFNKHQIEMQYNMTANMYLSMRKNIVFMTNAPIFWSKLMQRLQTTEQMRSVTHICDDIWIAVNDNHSLCFKRFDNVSPKSDHISSITAYQVCFVSKSSDRLSNVQQSKCWFCKQKKYSILRQENAR